MDLRTRRRAGVLGALLLLAACGGGPGPEAPEVLVFGRGADSVGLDPALENDGESFKVCDNLYETLVTYEPESTRVRPQLARRWEVSDDGLRWTFHLRTDVRFHDGTPFDAGAVLFSLGRQFFPDHPRYRPAAGNYKYWKDMGMDDIVAHMSAPDDSTFVMELAAPNAPFLSTLGMNFCGIVSPAAVERHGADFFKNPVGTGPFRFVEWRKDERIVLERFDGYWGEPPRIDRLVFKYIQDASVRFLELRSGDVHGVDNLNPEFIESIRSDPEIQLLTQPGMNVGYLAMNLDREPFGDLRVRRAVNHAVNKQSLVDNFYAGLAVPAKNPIPPSMWSYNDDVAAYEYDPGAPGSCWPRRAWPTGSPPSCGCPWRRGPTCRSRRRSPRPCRPTWAAWASRSSWSTPSGPPTSTRSSTGSTTCACWGGRGTTAIPTTSSTSCWTGRRR